MATMLIGDLRTAALAAPHLTGDPLEERVAEHGVRLGRALQPRDPVLPRGASTSPRAQRLLANAPPQRSPPPRSGARGGCGP